MGVLTDQEVRYALANLKVTHPLGKSFPEGVCPIFARADSWGGEG